MFNKLLLLLDTRKDTSTKKDTKKDYNCTMCNKSCKSDLILNKHLHRHSAMKTYLCTICGHQSTNSCHLDQHMRIHTGVRPFKCEVCEKTFSQKANLTRHKRMHSGEKPFICEICGKAFIESGKLSKHLRVHQGQKNYHCSKCGKQFAENRNLTQHMLIHSGEKPHKCLICERSFRYPSDLKEHKSVHSEVKPYTCIICNKSFKSVRNLKKHTKFLHNMKSSENCNGLQTSHLNDSDKGGTPDQISKDNMCIPEIMRSSNSAMSDQWPPVSQMSCATTISNTFSHFQTSLIQNDSDYLDSAFTSVPVTSQPKQKQVNITDTVLIHPPGVEPSSRYETLMIIQDKASHHMTSEQPVADSLFQNISSPDFSSSRISHIHEDDRVFIDISQSHPHNFPSQSDSIVENHSNTIEIRCTSSKESSHHMDVQTSTRSLEVLNNLPVDKHLQTAAESLLDLGEGCLNTDDIQKYSKSSDNREVLTESEQSKSRKKAFYLKSPYSFSSFTFKNEAKGNIPFYEVESDRIDQSFEIENVQQTNVYVSGPTYRQNSSSINIDQDLPLDGDKNNSRTATVNDINETCPKPFMFSHDVNDSSSTIQSLTTNKTTNFRTSERRTNKLIENIPEKSVKVDNSCIEERNEREKHVNRTPKEPKFECTVCSRVFRHKGSLRQHQQIHRYEHQRSKASTKCPTCSKVFSKLSNLNQHLKIHKGIKSFRCDVCGKAFLLRHSLQSHEKTHSEEKPHACHRCPSKFKFKQDLVNHNRIHTGIKPYQCAECGKTFSLNSTLNRHLRTHSGARPYSCNLCGRVFSQNGNMHQHMKTHQAVEK